MIARLTVADLVRPAEKRHALIYDTALVAGGSLVIAGSAQIAVGLPVPVTGQTFAVLMLAALLGSRRGVLCVLAYLAEGLMGLPVFSQGRAGPAMFFGPTGGFLLGFVPAAYVVGSLAERGWDRRAITTMLAMVLGSVAMYACGLAWLSCLDNLLGRPLGGSVLAVGLYPFLVGDVLKIVLATFLLPLGWKLIQYFRFENPAGL
ncbi:MAG TPA: biotin transporter BioY [Sedimentisphaerales bacterium]|nr:biotin transporter BioY [Sedimentisphaerales bacterium]